MERFTDAVCQAPKWLKSSSRETVWKLRIGSITGSHKPAKRDKRAPFRALRATEKLAIRPA
jgi:hypothetical protein